MVKWNVNGITQFCNSHRESGLSILKKVNHSVNGKTYNGYDLSVAPFNDSKEGAKNLHFNELKFKNQAARPVEDIMANLNIISSLAILTKALEEMNLLFEIMNILQNYCLK